MVCRKSHARFGRLLPVLALVAYGGAGVLGYGLHGLVVHDHSTACHHDHDHSGDGGHGEHEHPESSGGQLSVGADTSDCPICSFLAQGQTCVALKVELARGGVVVAKLQAWGAVVTVASLDLPVARGPPVS